MAAEQPPDLVLMDLQLPGIDGVETLRRLRARRPARRDVPVVAVTAFAMAEDQASAHGGGLRRLPREADQRARAGRRGREASSRGPAMSDDPVTVLAVDDQPQNLRLLDAVLGPRGYRVVTAGSGQEALATARRSWTSTWCCSTS